MRLPAAEAGGVSRVVKWCDGIEEIALQVIEKLQKPSKKSG